ncbi:hypothetical protein [Gordonia shandongensis]|uniref:hypothetical protein n=1 Tax=Gordonia shandongensis TaxID=376351 RepID=UPI001FDEA81F|nr:hypothetical protein [Gordonia shandongensis]
MTDRTTEFEDHLRHDLQSTTAGLLVEAIDGTDRYRAARDTLGHLMDEVPAGAHIALLTRFPATTIVGLTGHAALHRGGSAAADYWETFWRAIDREPDRAFEDVAGQLLGDVLLACGLRDVPALRRSSIVPLLRLHAGLSVDAVCDVIDLVEQHLAAGRHPAGDELLNWHTAPGFDHRRSRLPADLRRLLEYATPVARSLVCRIFDALTATVRPGVATGAGVADTADLPGPIRDAVADRLRRSPFLDGADLARELCASPAPQLRLDAATGEVRVMIPGASTPTVWRVWAGAAPEEIAVDAGIGRAVPVEAAIGDCILIDQASGVRRSVSVMDHLDPLIVFDGAGLPVSRFAPTPARPVTLLVPGDAEVHTESGPLVAEHVEVAGWDGWELRTVDPAGHREMVVVRDGRRGRTRAVAPVASPSIELPEPIVGVTTRDGEPVYAERPLVDLPADPPDGSESTDGSEPSLWRVRVRRAGRDDWLIDCPWASADYVTSADPFDGIEGPLVGRFEIVVGDAPGLDLRAEVVLAEDARFVHTPSLRLPDADGLTPAAVDIAVPEGIVCDTVTPGVCDTVTPGVCDTATTVAFDAATTDRAIVLQPSVHDDGPPLELMLRPPHAEIRHEHPGAPAVWRIAAATVDVESDAGPGRLTVRVPWAVGVTFALLDGAGDIVREWEPDEVAGTEFSLGTAHVAEASRRLSGGSLVALIEYDDGQTGENGQTGEADVAVVVRGGAPRLEGPTAADPLTAAWLALDAAHTDPDAADADGIDLLGADPTASLLALGDSPVAQARIPGLVIRSGLAESPFGVPDDSTRGAHPNPYIGCTLATGAIVDPAAAGRDEVQAYLATRGGDDLLRLIATGRMSDPRTGVFDRNVLAVDAMSHDLVDSLFARFRIVPGPVLDLDMRTAATIEAFHRRAEWMTDPVSIEAPRYVNGMLRDVRRASPELYDLIAARNEALDGVDTISHPWMLLSMQSLAFAAVGRLQAYGRLKGRGLDDAGRAMWARLADYCPRMVSADLLIANAVVVRADALEKVRSR